MAQQICECGCGREFEPKFPWQRFFERRCKTKASVRRCRDRKRGKQSPPPGGGPGGGLHVAYMGEGLSVRPDDQVSVIGHKQKRPPKPAALPMFPDNPSTGGDCDRQVA